jgi:hypothetical protein
VEPFTKDLSERTFNLLPRIGTRLELDNPFGVAMRKYDFRASEI